MTRLAKKIQIRVKFWWFAINNKTGKHLSHLELYRSTLFSTILCIYIYSITLYYSVILNVVSGDRHLPTPFFQVPETTRPGILQICFSPSPPQTDFRTFHSWTLHNKTHQGTLTFAWKYKLALTRKRQGNRNIINVAHCVIWRKGPRGDCVLCYDSFALDLSVSIPTNPRVSDAEKILCH